jgi:hypothetical protein
LNVPAADAASADAQTLSQLNEALEKLAVGPSPSARDVQDVVGLVVLLFVEAHEVADITRVVLRPRAQRFNVRLDSIAFFIQPLMNLHQSALRKENSVQLGNPQGRMKANVD